MSELQPGMTIVTGAGSGIGAAVARRLAASGREVLLVGRRREPLESIARSSAGRAHVHVADVVGATEPATIVAAALERWGRVDGLVNNAGAVEMAPIEATDGAMFDRLFRVNALAPALLAAALWPTFVRQGGGVVVNVSSMATVDPFPGLAVYAAAKAASESFVRSIRNEGDAAGIRAWAVAPGAVETPMLRGLFSADDLPPALTLDPDDVAAVIVACLLGERPEPSGSTILVPSGGPDATERG